MALSKKKTADDQCTGSECSAGGLDAANSGRRLGNVSTIAFGVGAVGLVVGTVLWFTAPRPAERVALSVQGWRADVEPMPSGGVALWAGRAW
jgi:hypothetical protein